tara:strand:+ start:39 stop:386 length:348 start_codon:yes stop_codon:yes gene_type:complete
MSTFKNITTGTTTSLLQASDLTVPGSNSLLAGKSFLVNKITIVNHDASDVTVTLTQVGLSGNPAGGNYPTYNITGAIIIPGEVSLVLDDSFSINLLTHSLKLSHTNNPTLTIRID